MDTSFSTLSTLEELSDLLEQLDALITVGMSSNINDLDPEVTSTYFWIGSDMLAKAKSLCAKLQNPSLHPPHQAKNA